MKLSASILSVTAALVLVSQTAQAQPGSYAPAPAAQVGQPYTPPTAQDYRHGFLSGVAVGPSLGKEGLIVSTRLGFMLSPRWAIMGEVNSFFGTDDNIDDDNPEAELLLIGTIGIQTWVSDRLWLRAGIGSGVGELSRDYESLDGLGWVAGVGYEVAQRRNFAFDIRFETFGGVFEEGSSGRAALLAGFSWY